MTPDKVEVVPAGLTKHDISDEEWREYQYPTIHEGKIVGHHQYKITYPETLYVKRSEQGDSHRVVDSEGITHYLPQGWAIIRWKAEPAVRF